MKRIIEILGLDEGATEEQCVAAIGGMRRAAENNSKGARISGEARALRRIATRAGITIPDDLDASEDARSELVVEISKRLGVKPDAKQKAAKQDDSKQEGDGGEEAAAKAEAQRKATINFMVTQKLRAGKLCHDSAVGDVVSRIDIGKLVVKEDGGVITDVDIPDTVIADVKKAAPHCFVPDTDTRTPKEGDKGDDGKDAAVESAKKYAEKVKM